MFFKQLAELATGMNLTMRINEKAGMLTVDILPDGVDKINPLRVSGTPEELDGGFIEAVRRPLSDTKTMLINQEQYIQNIQQQVKTKMETAEKKETKKPAAKASKASKPAKAAKPKPEKKAPAAKPEKKEAAPKPEPQPPAGPIQLTIG